MSTRSHEQSNANYTVLVSDQDGLEPTATTCSRPNRTLQSLVYTLTASMALTALLGLGGCHIFLMGVVTADAPLVGIDQIVLTNWVVTLWCLLNVLYEVSRRHTSLHTSRGGAPLQRCAPPVGRVLSVILAGWLVLPIWVAPVSSAWYWQGFHVLFIWTVAVGHMCLLSMITLPSRFEILYWTAIGFNLALAMVLSNECRSNNDCLFQPGRRVSRTSIALGIGLGLCDLVLTRVGFGTTPAPDVTVAAHAPATESMRALVP